MCLPGGYVSVDRRVYFKAGQRKVRETSPKKTALKLKSAARSGKFIGGDTFGPFQHSAVTWLTGHQGRSLPRRMNSAMLSGRRTVRTTLWAPLLGTGGFAHGGSFIDGKNFRIKEGSTVITRRFDSRSIGTRWSPMMRVQPRALRSQPLKCPSSTSRTQELTEEKAAASTASVIALIAHDFGDGEYH